MARAAIREELIPWVGNMSSLSWLEFGHARHGPSARIQVGVFFWLDVRRIRISPRFLRPGRNFSSDFLTRAAEPLLQDWAERQDTTRIRLGRKWHDFVDVTMSLRQYHELKVGPTAYYLPRKGIGDVFVELNPRSYSMCHFDNETGLRE